mmetsp:Transcript_20217/g.32795  ORF Transcript_20217/g.32795 Transcript_20217/m.32795 type:complete len:118 (-) Transcript_20217:641-994(-)|eukprot:CAMPEP_0196138716 /NCGR_PEP_ID=MMETSP0910-20130528/6252_1 /TAXON_ID=49265 /ORGANISM="Thalassiosira rotula, Strain GSO102" /LENGTH=117 /DNA_ID=CAMNT_0041399353 /DNA_START=273 /DNA_END=626 /DNA_ORIENTATION=+
MTPSSANIALLCLVALLSRSCSGFTISLAPLLTARLGLGPWGKTYVENFSSPVSNQDSSSPKESPNVKANVGVSSKAKPTAENFKFDYDDIRMISGCKSECLELIYAKSMDRGFVSA